MKQFVGIDLGTTNSAICTYDGTVVHVLKSPEQSDVTPSAILIDRRGHKYVGKRAYDAAPGSPNNAALLFKRLMGSNSKITFEASGTEKTPEECSAEILKTLYGYLPEEIRDNGVAGTVITVPAAFNLMQKNATLQAARLAGIGKVALMQEPVAAVMSVMRQRRTEGIFLIFDLGGGTLDVAIAENCAGRVSLLANGGIQMCGGRDVDRAIFDNIVKPWLFEHFRLPRDFMVRDKYKRLVRFANQAVERAKIELSAQEDTIISLSEAEAYTRDERNGEIYLDIDFTRKQLDALMDEKIQDAVQAARETMEKAGLAPEDIEKIVFIGGPTNYKPLRDKVSTLLGIASSTEVNPMTSVAEGAAIFAESIDWESEAHTRKASRAKMESPIPDLEFIYTARTSGIRAKLAVQVPPGLADGHELQVDSLDTGWTSGRIPLREGRVNVELNLVCNGENSFKVFVFTPAGQPLPLKENRIVIHRTAATVDIIPASHSIGIAVKNGAGTTLEWLIRAGDALPKKGEVKFRATETLRAGSPASLNLCLWEGEIQDPLTDNRPIGTLKIKGVDFPDGAIPAGAELICEYEILDSGTIHMEVTVPGIGATFPAGHNFYSRQDGQVDYAKAHDQARQEAALLSTRLQEMDNAGIRDKQVDDLKRSLVRVLGLVTGPADKEKVQDAMEKILDTKRKLAKIRSTRLQEIRRHELDRLIAFFDAQVRPCARPGEIEAFEALCRTARRAVDHRGRDFENTTEEMKRNNFKILWRQDSFVAGYFQDITKHPELFMDQAWFNELVRLGREQLASNEMEQLRETLSKLLSLRIYRPDSSDFEEIINITKA